MILPLKVKRLSLFSRLPSRTHATDAGWDLYADDPPQVLEHLDVRTIGTGLAVEIPPGHYGQILGRSSLAARGVAVLGGVIDSGYRGEVRVVLAHLGRGTLEIATGDRIAQLIILSVPMTEVIEVAELAPSPRATDGFGSSGK